MRWRLRQEKREYSSPTRGLRHFKKVSQRRGLYWKEDSKKWCHLSKRKSKEEAGRKYADI